MIKIKCLSFIIVASALATHALTGVSSPPQRSAQRASRSAEHAKAILRKSGNLYASASTYQDSGEVNVTLGGEQQPNKKVQFKTYFIRPDQFRFEWLDDSSPESTKGVVWRNGKEVSIYQTPYGLKRSEPMGLVAATVESEGAAQTIPRLLTDVGGFALTELEGLSLEREEQFDGFGCYVIKGKHQVPTITYAPYPKVQSRGIAVLATMELWIDKTSFLIRKIKTTDKLVSSVQEEIHREINLNVKIMESIFDPKIPTR